MRFKRVGVGEIVAVMVGDGRADDLAGRIVAREGGVGVGDLQLHFAADEFQRGVAHQRAGQQAGLDEDLEAVADADDLHALRGLFGDGAHDRHARGDGAAAQIVAEGEAAGNGDQVDVGDFGVGLPDRDRGLARNLGQRRDHVAVAVEAREQDDG